MTTNQETDCDISFEVDVNENENQFTIEISDEKNIHRNAEELYSRLQTHFSSSKDPLTVCDIYFNFINEVPKMFALCITSQPHLSHLIKDKEIQYKNLQTAGICFKILLIYLENPHTVDASKSIIQTSLAVLHEGYTHCKESEALYGDLFEEFTIELGVFYKHIQDVQNAMLKELDGLLTSDSFDKMTDSNEVKLIACDLGKLCGLVTCLDRMIATVLWKVFIKIISKYKDILWEKVQVDSFLLPLISNIEESIMRCIYNIEMNKQVDESEIKMSIVELSRVKKIVDLFKGHLKNEVILQFRNLSLLLYKFMVLSYSCTTIEGKELNVIEILLRTVRHVIIPFFSDTLFFDTALYCKSEEITSDLQISLVLIKMAVVNYIKSTNEQWQLLLNGEILIEILSTMKANQLEDDLKFVSIKIPSSLIKEIENENSELFSLYQHCYVCLAECFKHVSSDTDTIDVFERSLLEVFTSSSNVVSLLISDVWIYFLRCGSIDNLFKKCMNLSEVVVEMEINSRIDQLLIRMFKFLPIDYKVELFEARKNLNNLFHTHKCICRFETPCRISSIEEDHKMFCKEISSILTEFEETTTEDVQKLSQKACSILKLGALCVDKLLPDELLKFLEFSILLFKTDIFEIQIEVLIFFKHLSGKTLSRNIKELDLLTSTIAILLCTAMESKNYIIKFDAFNVYFSFAQATPHLEIIKKTVVKSPSLVPSIKSYAKKVPVSGFLKEDIHRMLKHLLNKYDFNKITQFVSSESRQILLSLLV